MSKEYGGGKDVSGVGGSNLPQRQQTLGEVTLEEFLVRAGVVREDTQLTGKPNNNGFFGDSLHPNNNTALGIGFQQTGQTAGLMANRIPDSSNQTAIQSATLPLNVNGVRSTQQQMPMSQPHQQQLFPKQATLAYTNPMPIPSSGQLSSLGIRGGMVGIADPSMTSNLVQSAAIQGGGMGMAGLGAGAVTVATGSPAVSSDGLGKNNGDTSSVSPVPCVFNGSLRVAGLYNGIGGRSCKTERGKRRIAEETGRNNGDAEK
uniref:Putative bZIP transcription factor bZIP8 n=1 Tax=Davidia involucrata TaxID=16924 RepID=A0A5B7C353_DAVIN